MSRDAIRSLSLFLHQEIEALAHALYDLIVHIGGQGSGKTVALVLWILDRSRWDTAQEHALFTYTVPQREQVLQRIYPWLALCGVRHVFNCRPPREWVEDWELRGIPQPPERDRYTNAITFSTGLRIQTGTLFNKAYEQWRGAEWGSVAVEEFTSGPERIAVEWVMDRVRCGLGQAYCNAHHLHTKILHGNPPEDDGHWVFDWLNTLQEKAEQLPGGIAAEEDDTYPSLAAGIGPILYIESSAEDNPQTGDYAAKARDRLDEETWLRRFAGKMRRRRKGRAYSAFARENEYPVAYHRDRTVYVALDFNNAPCAAGLWHPLNPGEFPSEHQRPGVKHIGKFAEIFHTRGGGLEALAAILLDDTGDVGDCGSAPSVGDDAGGDHWKGLVEHRGPIKFFYDATGNNKSASGKSLWDLLESLVGQQLRARNIAFSRGTLATTNELVPIRVRSYNAKLCSASGVRSAWIDPRNKYTTNDLMSVVWDKTKPDVQKYGDRGGKDLWLLTHLTDGDGALMVAEFPMGRERGGDGGVPKVHRRRGSRRPDLIVV